MDSVASRSLNLTGMFEAEVLVQLLLWRWDHPYKDDAGFCNDLLESASAALKAAVDGQRMFDDLPATESNLIAAVYFVEWSDISSGSEDQNGLRQRWLDRLRAAIPSCFHPQGDLPPT